MQQSPHNNNNRDLSSLLGSYSVKNGNGLESYLGATGATQKSQEDYQSHKRFEEQALKSGMSQMDTQKLLDLVKKYGGGPTQTPGEGDTQRSHQPQYLTTTQELKNDLVSQRSQYYASPGSNKHVEQNSGLQEFNIQDLTTQPKQFYEKVQKTQEEREKRLLDLKRKLAPAPNNNLLKDDSLVFNNQQQQQNLFQDDQSHIDHHDFDYEDGDRHRMLDLINKLAERQEDYEAMQLQIEQQALPQDNHQATADTYSVYNRLYSYAKTKQDTGQKPGVPQAQSRLSSHQSQNQSQMSDKSSRQQPPGNHLYQDFKERQNRLKAVQESQKHKQEQEMQRSKVNIKSHQLAYKKLERDLQEAVNYIDYNSSGRFNLTQCGQLLYVLGVFKYLYNEAFEQQEQEKKLTLEQALNQTQIKIEERKLREEEFLIQFWFKVNPLNEEQVDTQLILEFLKLIYDPYSNTSTQKHQEHLVEEYLSALSELHQTSQELQEEQQLWTVSDLLKSLRYLTENFANFKSNSGAAVKAGIKLPNLKERKNYYELYKECTFKPSINKKSEYLEKQHWAHFFLKEHQKNLDTSTTSVDSRTQMIGRIVSTTEFGKKNHSLMNDSRQQEEHPLAKQVQQLQHNPHQLKVNPAHRVELLLEKERLKQEKLKLKQKQEEQKKLQECTFKPNVAKSQNTNSSVIYERPSQTAQNRTAHERLWELSKAKRMQLPNNSKFDEQLEQMQECTFQPEINQKSKQVLRERSNEMRGQNQKEEPQYIKGYEESIMRLKRAKELQAIKKEQLENIGRPRNLVKTPGANTRVQPFQFQSEQLQKPQQPKPTHPLIDVEITVATGKTVHLSLHPGSDIPTLAKNFCKTYSLNAATRIRLEKQLSDYVRDKQQSQQHQQQHHFQEQRETPQLPVVVDQYSPQQQRNDFEVFNINEQQEEDEEGEYGQSLARQQPDMDEEEDDENVLLDNTHNTQQYPYTQEEDFYTQEDGEENEDDGYLEQ